MATIQIVVDIFPEAIVEQQPIILAFSFKGACLLDEYVAQGTPVHRSSSLDVSYLLFRHPPTLFPTPEARTNTGTADRQLRFQIWGRDFVWGVELLIT